ncbi:MAG: hypothetical protein J6I42_14265 [Clostridia bacterium]|nr:hypothetical protein [Clostridia bacterium]
MSKRILSVLFVLLFLTVLTVPASANMEEPPFFNILVTNAPDDLTITFITQHDVEVELRPLTRAWESYFRLYYSEIPRAYKELGFRDTGRSFIGTDESDSVLLQTSHLRLTSPSNGLDVTVDAPYTLMKYYNGLAKINLDPAAGTVTFDTTYMPVRNVLLVLLRVSVTLVTEGIIFFLMRYRTRRSWLVFLGANLVTQTILNITLTGYMPEPLGYWEFGYAFGEVLIFLAEAIVFALLLREQPKIKAVLTAVIANAFSLSLGIALFTYLPM